MASPCRSPRPRTTAAADRQPLAGSSPADKVAAVPAAMRAASRSDEPEQPLGGLLRAVLGDEVRGVDRGAAQLLGPRPPDLEHVAVEAGEGSALRPQRQHRALDPAPGG